MSKNKSSTEENASLVSTLGTIKAGKKMSVYRYLQDYSQGFYIDGLMKKLYAGQFKTKEEWDKVAEDLKNQVIY